jgi:3'(2'), 5'-bisphosphate nucleotidase
VRLGLLACPNLYTDPSQPDGEKGCLFLAIRGKGAFQIRMAGGIRTALTVSGVGNVREDSFTESVEPGHSDRLLHQRLAQKLNISKPSLKMDSQAKYGIVARGEVDFYKCYRSMFVAKWRVSSGTIHPFRKKGKQRH